MKCDVIHGDCLEVLRGMANNSVDLVLGSPPYEDARLYGIDYRLKGQDYVDWCVERYLECVRVCRGVVCWVIEGRTKNFRWTATPALLMADLHRAGVMLRKPPIYSRVGIAGSGGPDWWRNDYEFCICSTKGKLPWSDNTATGHLPKWAPGGEMSNRLSDGTRRNQWGGSHASDGRSRSESDVKLNNKGHRPSHILHTKRDGSTVLRENRQLITRQRDGQHQQSQVGYTAPVIANPGNIIRCKVGGGHMGSKLAHDNEAPYPESLVEPFVLSFCPPGGTVLDPFCGSGTTLAVAKRLCRQSIGIDCRESQVELTRKRLAEVQTQLFG